MNNQITIQALKYGDRLHYEWETTVLEKTDTHILVLGKYGRELRHYSKQKVFTVENWTIELFPFDSWFTVSADVCDGNIKQYYCNINEPAKIDITKNTVSFVDLDLDYIQRDGIWRVVDEDEFVSNAITYAYPEELIHRARYELAHLQDRIRKGEFPFDGYLHRFIHCIPE
jgi:uncharacterized protein